ncbi:MAG: NAD-dependent epimerase/dehydratase family protein [Oscillospiraceae bacterium]|nr:NAD-dependent epimerase/dehydratase family protein [Oscillospiraceae bacterium]
MSIFESELYLRDVHTVAALELPWEQLRGSSIMISGATGMIGSFLIDVLMEKGLDITVYALGRNAEKAKARFDRWWNDSRLVFVECDINRGISLDADKVDYVFHAASNTHPVAYATDPIGTITTNIIGTDNLLRFAAEHGTRRVLFASSVEVYGENRGDVDRFSEDYCGYLNCNTLRAGYPESKRAGEALCQAYIRQKGLNVVIPRLARTYGPTMLMSDTKALSQFLKKGIAGENIVLKSEGTQLFSYTYVADAVSGVLYCLFHGECGEAYNIADGGSDIMLKDLAAIIAGFAGKQVVFDLPDATERAGYSTATKAIMTSDKIRTLGWRAQYPIQAGLERTLRILKEDRQ